MQVAEFATEVKQVKTMKLHSDGVLVIWKWDWVGNIEKHEESGCNSIESDSNSEGEETHSEHEESEDPDPIANITHVVTFKCIGAVRDKIAQQTLRTVRNRMEKGYTVPLKLEPEPDNFWDSNAIAFMCCTDQKWIRIGYIVSELTGEVHDAIARIDIKRSGKWSSKVMARRSA